MMTGNPTPVSDAGVGALCVRAAALGAFLNVRINAAGYEDKEFVKDILARGKEIAGRTMKAEEEILQIVNGKNRSLERYPDIHNSRSPAGTGRNTLH